MTLLFREHDDPSELACCLVPNLIKELYEYVFQEHRHMRLIRPCQALIVARELGS